MNKPICEKCGGGISGEPGGTFAECANCGKAAPPSPNYKKRLIYAAFFLFLLSLPLLYLGGLYWFIARQPGEPTDYSIQLPDQIRSKPTPRAKRTASIPASEITRIEYTDSKRQKTEYVAQFFSNYAVKNYFFRESRVTFISDGRAEKTFVQNETVNRVRTPERSERHAGAFSPEQFAELARVFVENDFLGEKDSNTPLSSPTSQELTVSYSRTFKRFQAGNPASDTPEAEAMLKAFKDLENKIDWQREK